MSIGARGGKGEEESYNLGEEETILVALLSGRGRWVENINEKVWNVPSPPLG